MEFYFYVADDIQILSDGKPLMVGIYPDRVLIAHVPKDALPTSTAPLGLSSLSMMLSITGLNPGERIAQPVLTLPDGSPAPSTINPFPFVAGASGSANLLMKFVPFIVSQAGKYTLTVPIDGTMSESWFEVRFQEIENTGSSPLGAKAVS